MKKVLVFGLLLAACWHPIALTTLTPNSRDTVIDCASRQALRMGYTITDSNSAMGYLFADKLRKGNKIPIVGESSTHDVLSVKVVPTDSAVQKITVAGSTELITDFRLAKEHRTQQHTSHGVQNDASALLDSCTIIASRPPGAD